MTKKKQKIIEKVCQLLLDGDEINMHFGIDEIRKQIADCIEYVSSCDDKESWWYERAYNEINIINKKAYRECYKFSEYIDEVLEEWLDRKDISLMGIIQRWENRYYDTIAKAAVEVLSNEK
jgi:hypothetical protein